MKPFDDKFADNVREVFDAWDEPVDEQAWQDMKNRLTKRKKIRILPLIPFYVKIPAAAVLLLLASISIWQAFKSNGIRQEERAPLVMEHPVSKDTVIHRQPTAEVIAEQKIIADSDAPLLEEVAQSPAYPVREQKAPVYPHQELISKMDLEEESSSLQPALVEIEASVDTLQNLAAAEDIVEPESVEPPLTMTEADDSQIIRENLALMKEYNTKKEGYSGIEFSAGSMKTYSPLEVAGGMGYSAGVTGYLPLSEKISIGGGGLLVYNQFSLDDPYSSSKSESDYAYAPEPGLSGDFNVISRRSYADVEYMAIDIPLNFRFTLSNIYRGKLYLTAGFSSLLYLQQNISQSSEVTAQYSRQNTLGEYYTDTGQSTITYTNEYDAFSRLDLGRLLNLSIGYMLYRDKHSLLIEPFIKAPLGNVTSMDLYIGMAGVSLKYHLASP